MKRIITVTIIIIFSVFSFFNAYSVDPDGYDRGAEWVGAEAQIILEGESNCKVNFGLVKWIVEPEINVIYLCFMSREPGLTSDNTNVGISLQIENSDMYVFNVNTTPNQVDADKYFIDGAVTVDDNHGVTSEIKLGIKHGLPDSIDLKIRFIDSNGSPSNLYELNIRNTHTTTQNHNYGYDTGDYNQVHKTSSLATKNTSKHTSKTTKAYTDIKNNSNNDFIWDLLFGETTAKKDNKSTNKSKETFSSKTTRKTTKKKQTTPKAELIQTETESAVSIIANDETLNIQTEFKTNSSKNETYKIITLIAGGLSLVAISVLGTLKAKKENNNENDRNS